MSTQQTDALRLADWLFDNVEHMNHADAAAELRRLHALNADMSRMLQKLLDHNDETAMSDSHYCFSESDVMVINQLVAKAEGREA